MNPNKGIGFRYSLMKCSRRTTSARKIGYRYDCGYSTREKGIKQLNNDLTFTNISIQNSPNKHSNFSKSTIEPQLEKDNFYVSKKSRTTALSSGINSLRKNPLKVSKHLAHHENSRSKKNMSDVTIYCPNVGIIGDRRKPRTKFVIVPKNEYLK